MSPSTASIKLAVNGKFVNGIAGTSQKKGYLGLQSEGAEIHFRNVRIMELLPGVTSPEQTAPDLPWRTSRRHTTVQLPTSAPFGFGPLGAGT